MGFTPHESDHAKCGVYISANPITPSAELFISSTPNIGAKKSKSNSLLKNQIEIESREKTKIVKSLLTNF